MGFKKVIIGGIIGILVGVTCVYGSDIDSNSIAGVDTDPAISVETDVDEERGNIDFSIRNDSDSEMRDVCVITDEDSSIIPYKYVYDVGEIESGFTIKNTLGVSTIDNDKIKNLAVSVGGYKGTRELGSVICICIIFILISILFSVLSNRKSFWIIIGLVLIIASCGITFIFYSFEKRNVEEYKPGRVGKNYSMDVTVPYDGENLEFTLKYNQDDVVYKSVESTEEIDFGTRYEYDSDVACSDKPKVKVKGVKGKKKVVSTVKYINGEKVDSFVNTTEVIENPKDQVLIQGTKTTIDIVNIDAKKEYVPDDTMKVGDYKLLTDFEVAKGNVGKKEITYTWDSDKEEVVKSEKVTKEPGVNRWKAGSLVVREEIDRAKTKYVPAKDKPVGWENVVIKSEDGVRTTVYKTEVSEKTGKPIDSSDLTYYTTLETEPVNGVVEKGVLKTRNIVTSMNVEFKKDKNKWDNYKKVKKKGKDKIEEVTSIMKLDKDTGEVLGTVEKELSRKVIQKPVKQIVVVGTKEPKWVEEKIATEVINYSTEYKVDKTLKGNEEKVEVKGENGRLITTQLIAVDENGDKIVSYEPKVVEENALQKPVNEVIRVSPESDKLEK